jgi:hypothetical protein
LKERYSLRHEIAPEGKKIKTEITALRKKREISLLQVSFFSSLLALTLKEILTFKPFLTERFLEDPVLRDIAVHTYLCPVPHRK